MLAGLTAALAMSFSATVPSLADPAGDAVGAGIVGGMLGFMAGTAAANGADVYVGPPPPRRHYYRSDWQDHVAACEDDFGWRYDPRTDLVHLHGDVFPCND